MFISNILGVLKDTFLYPVVHAKDLSVVYIKTLIIYVVIGYVAVLITSYGFEQTEITKSLVYIINAILVLAVFLALMPLYVSVTRHVILGENFESVVLGRILKTREVMTFVSWAKVVFLMFIPIILAGLPMIVGLIQTTGGLLPDLGLGIDLTADKLILFVGILVGFYLAIRGSMMIIHAALDKDMSVGMSFSITKHHVLFIAIFLISYFLLTAILTKILLMIYGFIGGPLSLEGILAMPTYGAFIVTLITAFYDMLLGVIFVVGLSKSYQVITKK